MQGFHPIAGPPLQNVYSNFSYFLRSTLAFGREIGIKTRHLGSHQYLFKSLLRSSEIHVNDMETTNYGI